jgi:hypothetical protein
MRTNPDATRVGPEGVRAETPAERAETERVQTERVQTERGEGWPDMTGFHQRFQEIQSDFIDDPKAAVKKAERLIQEAMDHMAKSMHRDVDGKDGDTESLRLTLRRYRMWIESFGKGRSV